MQQLVLFSVTIGVVMSCAASPVQFTTPAKCQESAIKLTPTTTTATMIAPATVGPTTTDGESKLTISCTPDAGKTASMLVNGAAESGVTTDPTTMAVSIEVSCKEADDQWLLGTKEVMEVTCNQ